jgi:hypothetical protein
LIDKRVRVHRCVGEAVAFYFAATALRSGNGGEKSVRNVHVMRADVQPLQMEEMHFFGWGILKIGPGMTFQNV